MFAQYKLKENDKVVAAALKGNLPQWKYGSAILIKNEVDDPKVSKLVLNGSSEWYQGTVDFHPKRVLTSTEELEKIAKPKRYGDVIELEVKGQNVNDMIPYVEIANNKGFGGVVLAKYSGAQSIDTVTNTSSIYVQWDQPNKEIIINHPRGRIEKHPSSFDKKEKELYNLNSILRELGEEVKTGKRSGQYFTR